MLNPVARRWYSVAQRNLDAALTKMSLDIPTPTSIYAKILIHNFPFTVTKNDTIITHRIRDVRVGDIIRLERIRELGTANYTLKAKHTLTPPPAVVTATVMEHGHGRWREAPRKRQRKGRRPKRTLKPALTILRINDIRLLC